jgi:ring-1,2-phenylacetyl-CoA epoxidase subunit PaaD
VTLANSQPTGVPPGLLAHIEAILATIPDPEIPVVSIRELGILRDVRIQGQGDSTRVEVIITPTYSGCPAIGQIEDDIRAGLAGQGIQVLLIVQLAPAWTTDWITHEAKEKLRAYGIAPPHSVKAGHSRTDSKVIQFASKTVANYAHSTWISGQFNTINSVNCPQCDSANTTETSHFGSTACKALYRCLDCLEPFDYFKPY